MPTDDLHYCMSTDVLTCPTDVLGMFDNSSGRVSDMFDNINFCSRQDAGGIELTYYIGSVYLGIMCPALNLGTAWYASCACVCLHSTVI